MGRCHRAHNRAVDYVIGGWQVSPFLQLTSGSPFDISVGAAGSGPSVRPNLVSLSNLYVKPTAANNYQVLNAADFAAPPVNAAGVYATVGNVHKNQFRSSNYSNLSMSAFKDFTLFENVKGQLRGQVYNLFNSPAFAPPGNTGLPANFNGPGTATANLPTFTNITNVDYFSQRLVELAVRISF